MKKLLITLALVMSALTFTGCQAFGNWYSDNKQEIYTKVADKAIEKLEGLIDMNVNKLVTDGKITETYAAELKASCKKAVKDAFAKIDELIQKNKQQVVSK
jgi:hypothetical protein